MTATATAMTGVATPMTATALTGGRSFVSCTGERLAVDHLSDLPPGLAGWRHALLAERRRPGPGRAGIRLGRCLLLDDVHAALEFGADDPLITVWSDGTYSDRYLDHLLRDHVVPRRLCLRGERVLHATAVSFDGLAVAFVGVSTAGKSTLAAAGGLAGGRLLADDTLRLVLTKHGVAVLPTATQCRLRADVASVWMQAAAPQPIDRHGPVALGLVCIVERGVDPMGLTACPPAAGLVALTRSAFVPEASEVDRASVLDRFLPVCERIPVATLRYPNGLDRLPEVVDLVRNYLDSPVGNVAPTTQWRGGTR
jgi:hypothetical protein